MSAHLQRVRTIATSDLALTEIADEFRRWRDEGIDRSDVLEAFESLRSETSSHAEEDRILELMDVVAGFCRPELRVWD